MFAPPKKEGQHSVKLTKEPTIIDNGEPEILVYRHTSGRSLVIPMKFNINIIKATVDTADMITLADYRMSTKEQLSESRVCETSKLRESRSNGKVDKKCRNKDWSTYHFMGCLRYQANRYCLVRIKFVISSKKSGGFEESYYNIWT